MNENFRPSGHWEGYSWYGRLPDGTGMRFTSEEEYLMRFTSEEEYLEYLHDNWSI